MSHPLVSFCLQAYNQREYIDAALDGAFAQTYRPLEIVISDDHSTDGTWERIQEKLKNSTVHLHLSPSPTVILHRNPTNLKNIANLEIFGTLAHGELLVKADSDDISEPDRVQRLVDAWLADAKRARVLSSGCRLIDATGRVLGERHTACLHYPTGAMMAWTRDCFVGWPAVPRAYMADDVVWCARAQLLGGAELVLPDPLVRYRTVGFTTRGTSYRASLARIHRTEIAALPTSSSPATHPDTWCRYLVALLETHHTARFNRVLARYLQHGGTPASLARYLALPQLETRNSKLETINSKNYDIASRASDYGTRTDIWSKNLTPEQRHELPDPRIRLVIYSEDLLRDPLDDDYRASLARDLDDPHLAVDYIDHDEKAFVTRAIHAYPTAGASLLAKLRTCHPASVDVYGFSLLQSPTEPADYSRLPKDVPPALQQTRVAYHAFPKEVAFLRTHFQGRRFMP